MEINPVNSVVTYTDEPLSGKRIRDTFALVLDVQVVDGITILVVGEYPAKSYVIVVPDGMLPLPVVGSRIDLKYVIQDYPEIGGLDLPTLFQYKLS